MTMNVCHIIQRHQPLADSLLVGDKDYLRRPCAENSHRFYCAGQPLELAPITNVVSNDLTVDNAVPIEE